MLSSALDLLINGTNHVRVWTELATVDGFSGKPKNFIRCKCWLENPTCLSDLKVVSDAPRKQLYWPWCLRIGHTRESNCWMKLWLLLPLLTPTILLSLLSPITSSLHSFLQSSCIYTLFSSLLWFFFLLLHPISFILLSVLYLLALSCIWSLCTFCCISRIILFHNPITTPKNTYKYSWQGMNIKFKTTRSNSCAFQSIIVNVTDDMGLLQHVTIEDAGFI